MLLQYSVVMMDCDNVCSSGCRMEEARKLMEEVVSVKEATLGAVHPDVAEDRARLQAIISEVPGHRSTTFKKSRKLVEMLTSARKAFHSSK